MVKQYAAGVGVMAEEVSAAKAEISILGILRSPGDLRMTILKITKTF